MQWRTTAGGMSNKLAFDSSAGLCSRMTCCIQGKLLCGAIESSLERELLARNLLTKLLKTCSWCWLKQWMDTRQREECLSCHWWKNKLVIGGKFEGKDWHDRRTLNISKLKTSKYL
jgi:hypothetical protein